MIDVGSSREGAIVGREAELLGESEMGAQQNRPWNPYDLQSRDLATGKAPSRVR